MLKNGLTVSNRQSEAYMSDAVVYAAAAQIRNINLMSALGAPASFLRIIATQTSELWFKKPGKNEMRYYEGLTAALGLNINDENVEYFRVIPSAYPCTITYYASAYTPPANPPVARDQRHQ
jgi:hypothetical protein